MTSSVDGHATSTDATPAHVNGFLDPDGLAQADAPAPTSKETRLPEMQAAPAPTENTPKKHFTWPTALAWIPKNMSWPHAQDIFRCTLAAWVSLLLILIQPVEDVMGIVRHGLVSVDDTELTIHAGELPHSHCRVPVSSRRAVRSGLRARDAHSILLHSWMGVRL
jgi:hypothetical protein